MDRSNDRKPAGFLMDIFIADAKRFLKSIFGILLIGIFIEAVSFASGSNQTNPIVNTEELVILGKWNESQLDHIINESSKLKDLTKRIDFLSGKFLNVDYQGSTLIGSISTPEVFVIDLEGVDCFTYIDYVEAMRLSRSFPEFKENLRTVRYQSGTVSFLNRNHFFTDWEYFNSSHVDDITEKIGGDKTKTVLKTLNEQTDGAYFIPGIPPKERKVHFIPSHALDDEILLKLKSGDYIGIYSNLDGLDVSHVGILIKHADKVYLRHASTSDQHKKVIDEDFMSYISDKPGIVIFRPK
jgi:hypothetical protein